MLIEMPDDLSHARKITETASGFDACRVARHPSRDEVFNGGLDVIAQLVIEIGGGIRA
jgi:hypothetical protein